MFNIAYRAFLYSYAFWAICIDKSDESASGSADATMAVGDIMKKVLLNPIIIATVLGFALWALQLVGNNTDTSNWWVVDFGKGAGAF